MSHHLFFGTAPSDRCSILGIQKKSTRTRRKVHKGNKRMTQKEARKSTSLRSRKKKESHTRHKHKKVRKGNKVKLVHAAQFLTNSVDWATYRRQKRGEHTTFSSTCKYYVVPTKRRLSCVACGVDMTRTNLVPFSHRMLWPT